ncbi:hypothetical protein, conserved [Trypanosoma brucei gambiense DAL972]|uniref:DUF6787 domain-containing protein n=2 Tax=Trypanosoma brucei TaxID=5691 RepID=D0A0J0_TRYB9|nr:hypothetical protein, conserved [Trypanosoma brucei gambiense DAL972]RHW69267.1 hypothetical protein DPX39_100159200 [Trypanosoma brucei equiperdum]CBH16748.1 hypothetical protein, conserved [Trypanosoma brucei gambiense DAL972]|eukprot:XP_011779012.1 hypothetical protein, conserved [Trypanosoma brucei gambiense DAL972]
MYRLMVPYKTAKWASASAPRAFRNAFRRCSTQEGEAAAASRTGKSTVGDTSAGCQQTGPQRKDWRTGKEVVYVKGVPVKGPLRKLPRKEQILVCVIFSITGSAAVYFVRPVIRNCVTNGFLGLPEDSSWSNGPWLYRLLYVSIMYPSYSFLLFVIGSLFGRRVWFSFMIHKMWSRFLPKKAAKRLEHMLDLQHY